MTYLVDANIFLRVIVKDVPASFNECVEFLQGVKKGRFKAVTTNIALAEVVWTLLSFYNFSKKDTVAVLKGIRNLSGLKVVDDYNFSLALDIYENNDVKYIDSLLASIKGVKSGAWIVVSYDRDFDRLGVIRKEPREVIK